VRLGKDGSTIDKPSELVPENAELVVEEGDEFVSRGGIKLSNALDELPVEVADRLALDVGASTGGFTDCLLQRGARMVLAVDVGYGQLDWRLRRIPECSSWNASTPATSAIPTCPFGPR
jgi:23S rRNA (cytidine1920-2'-O)/16S rRNA (cytidine1409-2'-O)-methyltransferase